MSDDAGYRGPAHPHPGQNVPVTLILDARHEPYGKVHRFGRLTLQASAESGLVSALTGSDNGLELRTDGGRSAARIGDLDPWGRYRVTGVGRPPFALDEPDPDVD